MTPRVLNAMNHVMFWRDHNLGKCSEMPWGSMRISNSIAKKGPFGNTSDLPGGPQGAQRWPGVVHDECTHTFTHALIKCSLLIFSLHLFNLTVTSFVISQKCDPSTFRHSVHGARATTPPLTLCLPHPHYVNLSKSAAQSCCAMPWSCSVGAQAWSSCHERNLPATETLCQKHFVWQWRIWLKKNMQSSPRHGLGRLASFQEAFRGHFQLYHLNIQHQRTYARWKTAWKLMILWSGFPLPPLWALVSGWVLGVGDSETQGLVVDYTSTNVVVGNFLNVFYF